MLILVDCLFMLALLAAFVLQEPLTLAFGAALCACYATLSTNFREIDLHQLFLVTLVVMLCLLPSLDSKHGAVPLFYLFSSVSAFYAAKHFSQQSLTHIRRCLSVVFWLCVSIVAFFLVRYRDATEPLGEIIQGSSTNGIPSYLIVLQATLSIAVFLESRRLPVLSAIATLVVAVFGLGRGSIVVAALILLSTVMANNFLLRAGLVRKSLVLLVLGVAFLISFGLWWQEIFSSLNQLIEGSKFSGGVMDEHRGLMLSDYIGKLDFMSFLLGDDYSGTSIATLYGGNPHIAYIRTHSFYGFFGLSFVLLLPFLILFSDKRAETKIICFSFVLLVFIRASSEPILFPTLLDFFLFLCFFAFWQHAPAKRRLKGVEC